MLKETSIFYETFSLKASAIEEEITLHCYLPTGIVQPEEMGLLLINDGQDLPEMKFGEILDGWIAAGGRPLLCVGIEAGESRVQKYGMKGQLDYLGRGTLAGRYQHFIEHELYPFILSYFKVKQFHSIHLMGFSLGALSMLDFALNNSLKVASVGVMSGSLWWRKMDKNHAQYDENTDRLMHYKLKQMTNLPDGLKFFFECGTLDEKEDRNKNGVIDSIDDTIDLMRLLSKKGKKEGRDYFYYQIEGGKHDVATWAKAIPVYWRKCIL